MTQLTAVDFNNCTFEYDDDFGNFRNIQHPKMFKLDVRLLKIYYYVSFFIYIEYMNEVYACKRKQLGGFSIEKINPDESDAVINTITYKQKTILAIQVVQIDQDYIYDSSKIYEKGAYRIDNMIVDV